MGLSDEDLRYLQEQLTQNPWLGDVIQGTGGVRKMRFLLPGRGKSSGARILYVDFLIYETIYLLYAYPKNVKEDLTISEKNNIKKLVSALRQILEKE